MTINRERRSRKRGGTERRIVSGRPELFEPPAVPLQSPKVREQVEAKRYRLGVLLVRHTRHDRARVFVCAHEDCLLNGLDEVGDEANFFPCEEARVGRNLVVA